MKISEKKQKIIDIIQWILIIILVIICGNHYLYKNEIKIYDKEINTGNTFMKIYESQTISDLKKINRDLYDSIEILNNKKSAIEIRYETKYEFHTDSSSFKKEYNDSLYNYTIDNDTLLCNLLIKAYDLDWVKGSFKLKNQKFRIINSIDEKTGFNKTFVSNLNNKNTMITHVDTWSKKNRWVDRFNLSIQAGVGYGIINKNADIFIGLGISYQINKKKK